MTSVNTPLPVPGLNQDLLNDARVASGFVASSSGDAGGQLSKKDQKKLGALIAKHDAYIAAAKKVKLQIEALKNGSAAASGENVVFDAGEDEVVQAGAVDEKAGCCAIV